MNTVTDNMQNTSIFILDDDRFYLEYMKEIIYNYSSSINTQTFCSKSEMMSNLGKKPDVIILDYNLGIENSSRITAHSVISDIENTYPNQYIVLISGESNAALLEEYNRYRNLDFIVKSPNVSQDIVSLLNKRIKTVH
jgi:FixJ family two-component response regulator